MTHENKKTLTPFYHNKTFDRKWIKIPIWCPTFIFYQNIFYDKMDLGYLRCKIITSQNVSTEAKVKNFFILQKSYAPFSRYSSFCIFNHPMIFQICDVMMSISTWDTVHFLIYLLNHNSITYQTWSFDRYKQGQYFSKTVWKISRTGAKFQALFNLATCSNYSITNYAKFAVIGFFWKCE